MKTQGKHKLLITLFKVTVLALCIYFIYKEVFQNENIDNYSVRFAASLGSTNGIKTLLFVVFLMLLNWSLETIKWKFLVRKILHIKFFSAFKAVFTGITMSLVTPNRVGEVVGRLFFVPKDKIGKTVVANIVGSAAQLLVTVFMGTIGLLFVLMNNLCINELPKSMILLAFMISLICLALGGYAYFNPRKINNKLQNIKWLNRFTDSLKVLEDVSRSDLNKVLVLSLLRYFVFATQFILLLNLFHFHNELLSIFLLITVLYLATTLVPTLLLGELGLRESFAILILGFYYPDTFDVFAATFLLWCINLAFPSLIGAVFLFLNKSKHKAL